jgi:hypothetical protein
MTFAEVLEPIRGGRSARRASWPHGRFVRLSPSTCQHIEALVPGLPWSSPWHATSPDLLAVDWEVADA